MADLWQRLWALCLLRQAPQDLPYSLEQTRSLVAMTVVLDLGFVLMAGLDEPALRVVLGLLTLLLVPWLLLAWRARRERYPQTLSAVAGSGVLLTLMLLPVVWLAQQFPAAASAEQVEPLQLLFALLVLVMYAWTLMVRSHILRHALDLPRSAAALIALGWFLLELLMGSWITGPTA